MRGFPSTCSLRGSLYLTPPSVLTLSLHVALDRVSAIPRSCWAAAIATLSPTSENINNTLSLRRSCASRSRAAESARRGCPRSWRSPERRAVAHVRPSPLRTEDRRPRPTAARPGCPLGLARSFFEVPGGDAEGAPSMSDALAIGEVRGPHPATERAPVWRRAPPGQPLCRPLGLRLGSRHGTPSLLGTERCRTLKTPD